MPKGHKLIEWTAENDARLMLTVLAVENLHPNYEAVAAAFGAGLNAQAIKNRLSRLRKKAADEGLLLKAGGGAETSTKGHTGETGKTGKKSGVAASAFEHNSPDLIIDDDDSSDATVPLPTHLHRPKSQKVLFGRVTKAVLPRPGKKSSSSAKRSEDVGHALGKDDAVVDPVDKSEMRDQEDDAGRRVKVELECEE